MQHLDNMALGVGIGWLASAADGGKLMPLHDWTRVDAGTFHGFHTAWLTHLSESLNGGLLPKGYYALPEQHGSKFIVDVLTLHTSPAGPERLPRPASGGLAVAERPPQVQLRRQVTAASRTLRRTLTIRHVTGHRIVALVEIVSPANKDRPKHVDDFVTKVTTALSQGIHVTLADLLPPGPCDPMGMDGAVWEALDESDEPYQLPAETPMTLAAYVADLPVEVYLEHLRVGQPLKAMPLFLTPDDYIDLPLESTYQAAFRGMPEIWREVLER
jgi:hypothetical protein